MTDSLYPEAAWDKPQAAVRASSSWVERLALTVLVLTLLYAVLGSAGGDTSDATQSDHVDPLNSRIWLGLLALSLPVLQQRWRDVVALLLSNWPLLLLLGYFATSVSWALDPATSLRRFLFTVVQFSLFAIVITGIRRAPLVHVAIAAVCAIAAGADLVSWVVAPGFAMTEDGFAGLQGQKNQTGLLMMYGCLAAVPCLFLLRSWRWRIALAAGTLLMGALLVATRSTTSQSVVISAAFVMPVLLLIGKLPKRAILAVAACFVFALLAAFVGYLGWCGATGTDPMLPLRGVTFTERTPIWALVIDEIKKRPFFGAGYSSFWAIDPAVQPSLKSGESYGVYEMINEGHDGYLDQLATVGVVGLFGTVIVLIRSIALAGRAVAGAQPTPLAWRDGGLARPTAVFHLALLLGLVMHNVTESNLFNNSGLLAVAFLIAVVDLEKWRIATRRSA